MILMAKKIVKAVKKAVKRVVKKRPAAKREEVVEIVPTLCGECSGRGLKDQHTLCTHCTGSGTL